ncbi:TRAP transporter fused permease subunit [Angelakisella massiliensis]|uniref:TRAP transporter permease n=1 Tax=Angelakisella massiliensis TaxID=1871018 RepID=UPI0024B1FB21|nr:TRAP transporter fused permease subunit [Angelakisella massiliensis]
MEQKLTYEKFRKYFVIVLSVFTGLLHIGQFTFCPMESIKFYSWHLTLGLMFVFLYKPLSKKNPKKYLWADWLCILLTVVSGAYVILNYDTYVVIMQTGKLTTGLYVFGLIVTLLVIEATRRCLGWILPIISLITVAYALFGGNLPGILGHRGYSFQRVVTTIFSDQGVLGTAIGVSASNVFLFLLFAAFLSASGADKIFQDISIALTGKKRGGPAKMAVVASCLFGSISGSAVANVVSTGAFTIPLMKRQGYQKRFAGAVEAVASTGGQIMPPIMGAAAFVLADISGTPYGTVCLSALLPALMYYLTLFKMVDLESVKYGLQGVPEEELPNLKESVAKGFKLFIPLAILLFLLLVVQTTPMLAAIYAMIAIVICGLLDKHERLTFKGIIDGFVEGGKSLPSVVAACACAGIVTGMFALTGLGLKFSDFIVSMGGSSIILSLLLSMIVCVILGMGLPTTASYIICATAIAPALVKIGVMPLAAHMFLLYFACISAITPPVAVASYAAAGLAEENPMKVGFTAVKLGIAGFVLPFVFTLNTDYLHMSFDVLTLFTWVSAFVVCYAAACAIQGYVEQKITIFERIGYVVVVCTAIQSSFIISLVGWALFAALYGGRVMQHKKQMKATAA